MIINSYNKVMSTVKEINPNATLLAVSKTYPASDIKMLYDLGQRDFGENRVQELVTKIEILPKDIRWHLIGHLQKNKVKYIVGKVCLIHSVDSIDLALAINKESIKKNITTNILIQVNLAKEIQKSGIFEEDLYTLLEECSSLTNIKVQGLMLIPPIDYNYNQLADIFDKVYKLSLDIESKRIDNINMQFLSYGMSNDYKIALEHKSNIVRVGSCIFGKRVL